MKRIAFIIAALLLGFGAAYGQHAKVRAIFLLQLSRYASWQIGEESRKFIITVVGADDVAQELMSITRGKTVQGIPIDIVTSSSPRNLPKSDLIYLDSQFTSKTRTVISDQYGNKTLVIGSEEGMCANGAHVSFVDDGTKVGFEWSKHNLEKSGVKISPKVLTMGKELY
ncbi:MAG: YfiR family protein [Bacteroidales bacterium]|nr:YfiR family protein [Bacteroidales bacterium]MDY4175833.1 YfiR family protein [Bacteroidales bacterium]